MEIANENQLYYATQQFIRVQASLFSTLKTITLSSTLLKYEQLSERHYLSSTSIVQDLNAKRDERFFFAIS